jgi:hypothetical protein
LFTITVVVIELNLKRAKLVITTPKFYKKNNK